ncbi:MAG: DNA polymerase I [Anaerolineae bacterium]|nr:DNA polymerase I [Anaerolineae bacterium]
MNKPTSSHLAQPIPQLLLIDGHALAYRMFYALPVEQFTTSQGEPTNATYGFTRTLLERILSPTPPQYLAVTFDLGGTFRDDLFAEYKGTRAKMPDELQLQIERIKQVVQALNIPIWEMEGYEADDLLGTVARQANPLGVPVLIITGDRDLLQLVDENTQVELPPGGKFQREAQVFDVAGVIAKYQIEPGQIVDFKALVGDTSDNIPGVKGIGEKTATRLLQQYSTLDGIYAHLAELKKGEREKLEAEKETAYLSYKLAQIVTDAPITLDLEACLTHDFDPNPALALFRELEFRSLTRMLAEKVSEVAAAPPEINPLSAPYETVTVRTPEQLQKLVQELNQASLISFDLETTGLEKMTVDIVGICLATSPEKGYYIPVGHWQNQPQTSSGQMNLFASEPRLVEKQLPLAEVLDALRPPLTNPNIAKVAHNAKFDYTIFDRKGVRVAPITFDTMIGEWLINPDTKFKGLKDSARHRLGVEMTQIEHLIGTGKNQRTFAEVPIEDAAAYGAADAVMTLRLVEPLQKEITRLGLSQILDIEMPLVPILSDMEQIGVRLDVPFFSQMGQELNERLKVVEAQIHQLAGEPFNINSPQQLSDILFKKLNLPREGLKKNKTGYYSTAVNVLESLEESDSSGIIGHIMEYRELGKLKSTYVDALPTMVNPETGRVHTSFNQTGSVTGRIASNSPNLQNIPIRTELGQKIRRGFVPAPGKLFLAADYSQIELRILAHISQDEALCQAFWQDQDIHRATAAAVFNIPVEEVTFQQRRFAKSVNFGLIYGMGAYRLSRDSEFTLAEAENYIKQYFARFPGIDRYLSETREKARRDGYVETLLGRRRYFELFQSAAGQRNVQAQMRAEREAVNHPIQGTAADIVKIAMIMLHQRLSEQYQARMILQVHDELVLELPVEEVEQVQPLVVEIMSTAFQLHVPLKVEASIGNNWLELKG